MLRSGMEIMGAKLKGVGSEKIVSRITEQWTFFFGTVLPYLQGVLSPFHMELRNISQSGSSSTIRVMVLVSFRDHVLLPQLDILKGFETPCLTLEGVQKLLRDPEAARRLPDHLPRMIQMLAVLNEIRDSHQKVVFVYDG